MTEQRKILVLRAMSESEIKNLGGVYMIRKKAKNWITMLVISLVWVLIIPFILQSGIIMAIVAILPLILVFIAWYYSYIKGGKRFLEAIKNREQPVRLNF